MMREDITQVNDLFKMLKRNGYDRETVTYATYAGDANCVIASKEIARHAIESDRPEMIESILDDMSEYTDYKSEIMRSAIIEVVNSVME